MEVRQSGKVRESTRRGEIRIFALGYGRRYEGIGNRSARRVGRLKIERKDRSRNREFVRRGSCNDVHPETFRCDVFEKRGGPL